MPRRRRLPDTLTIQRAELVKRLAVYRLDQDARAIAVIEDLLLWFDPAVRVDDLDHEVTTAAAELAAWRRTRSLDD